jgi:tetratricopeptide (TPR) repeat protein
VLTRFFFTLLQILDTILKAKLAKKNERFKVSKSFFERLETNFPDFGDIHLEYADLLSRFLDDPEKAKIHYLKHLRFNPHDSVSYYNLALIYFKNDKDYDLAKSNLDKFLDHNPSSHEGYNFLGLIWIKLCKLHLAETCFLKAIEINKSFSPAITNLAFLYVNTKQFELARSYYLMAIKFDEGNDTAMHDLATLLHIHFKDYESAEKFYTKSIKTNPDHFGSYFNLAVLYNEKLNDPILAKKNIEYSLKLNPNSDKGNYYMGKILSNYPFNNYNESITYFQKAISINPNNIEAHYELATIYETKIDNIQKAINQYSEVTTLDPLDKGTLNKIAILCQKNGEFINAKEYFLKAIDIVKQSDKKDINDAIPFVNLANLLASEFKDYINSKDLYEEALLINEMNKQPIHYLSEQAHYNLGVINSNFLNNLSNAEFHFLEAEKIKKEREEKK